jgi:hypothetical protein
LRPRRDAIEAGHLDVAVASHSALVGAEKKCKGRIRSTKNFDDPTRVSEPHAATSDGAFEADAFAGALAGADAVLEPDAPFHIHFSDIQYANRNETKHLPYGEGTLRAEPLREALARFERPATVISEAPDAVSTRLIGDVLLAPA